MNSPTVFISHASADGEIAVRFAEDLRERGADVWLDATHAGPGNFVARINQALRRDVLVLLLSPAAIHSPWVQQEMGAAIVRSNQRLMRPPLVVQVATVELDEIPALWTVYHRYDAVADYVGAVNAAIGEFNLGDREGPDVLLAITPSPELVPVSLQRLGFAGRNISGVEVIVPPVCDVPAGPFLMGSDLGRDPCALENELPQHQINVGPFQIARYPVTVAEYARAVQAKAVPPPRERHGFSWQDQLVRLDHPVVSITWNEASVYAAWLAEVTRERWRLPTEAEWEKAARGTDGRVYPWSDRWDDRKANAAESGLGDTTPVGTYLYGESPYGAQDMAGNVWEWCSSLFKPYLYRADDGREDSKATGTRVMRGGSGFYSYILSRSAYRDAQPPAEIGRTRGFRLVRG